MYAFIQVRGRIVLVMSAVAMAVDAMPADGAVSVESTVSLGYASCVSMSATTAAHFTGTHVTCTGNVISGITGHVTTFTRVEAFLGTYQCHKGAESY